MEILEVFLFGFVTEELHLYSAPMYFFLWLLNGFFQSVAWPTEVCIVGNWFGRGSRGLVLGAWSACASAGNIFGTLVTSRVLIYGYQYAFGLNSVLLFVFGFVVYFVLVAHPREIGLPDPSQWSGDTEAVIEVMDQPRPIGFLRAWLLPGVIAYSLAYACLKLVNYGFFFWLPYYLNSNFGWSESKADTLSMFYDIGGIIAAVLGGALSDRLSSRTPVVFAMLLVSSFALFFYSFAPGDFVVNALLLSVVGFFVGGPANMISSCVSADLGKARELHGQSDALSTVTGIVDGTGSLGAAIGQLGIKAVQRVAGWPAVFYGFIVMVLATAAFLMPLLWKEWKSWMRFPGRTTSDSDVQEDMETDPLIPDASPEENTSR